MEIEITKDWVYLSKENEKPPYHITGKYLFFNEDQDRLIDIAEKEFNKYGFHLAKVSNQLLGRNTEYVLCLYYMDRSRANELAKRNEEEYKVKYRFWKSDAATRQGEYSKEFLNNLSKE